MVDLVDNELEKEMKAAGRGSILHDGWTCAGVHYVALFACYPKLKEAKVKLEKKEENVEENDGVLLSLVSLSPMARTEMLDSRKEELDVSMKLL